MSADEIFKLCNSLALAGWLILVFAGRARWAARLLCGVAIPLLLACAYLGLLLGHWSETSGNFNTLSGVAALFSNRWLLLAGWIHYLAFDLFIGSWQVRDSQSNGISHLLVIPCLVLTFLFGPTGLLLYFVVRFIRTRSLLLESSLRANLKANGDT
jgi:hypothetical protein